MALDQKVMPHILRSWPAPRNAEYLRKMAPYRELTRPQPTHGLTSDSPRDANTGVTPCWCRTDSRSAERRERGHALPSASAI